MVKMGTKTLNGFHFARPFRIGGGIKEWFLLFFPSPKIREIEVGSLSGPPLKAVTFGGTLMPNPIFRGQETLTFEVGYWVRLMITSVFIRGAFWTSFWSNN